MENNKKEKIKKIIRLAIALLVIISISVGFYYLFQALGITDVNTLKEWTVSLGGWFYVVFLLLQIVVTTLLSFVPVASLSFIAFGTQLFENPWIAFLICFTGVILSSILMDFIGRFGGSKLIKFLIGEDDYNEAAGLVQEKGMVYVPVMYLLPMFPDDAICMVVGATKMNFWVHLLEIVLCRGIGCATIVFGVTILPEELMSNLRAFNWGYIGEHLFEYIEMLTVIVFWVIVMLYIARRIDKFLTKRMKKKQQENEPVEDNKEEDKPEGESLS